MKNSDKIYLTHFMYSASVLLVVSVGVAVLGMWGCPQYTVYKRDLQGQAELKQASHNRKIEIHRARAKLEAAKSLAKAEVERAKGVAKANQIIGQSLKNNESYLRYLWVQGLHDGSSEVIYVPTEANLPILEAGKVGATKKQKKK